MVITGNNYDYVLSGYASNDLMTAPHFPEQEDYSFSQILRSKEIAAILKQVVKESRVDYSSKVR